MKDSLGYMDSISFMSNSIPFNLFNHFVNLLASKVSLIYSSAYFAANDLEFDGSVAQSACGYLPPVGYFHSALVFGGVGNHLTYSLVSEKGFIDNA